MQKIIQFTNATKDQEHINMMVLNHATIPDRTAYIVDATSKDPYPEFLANCRFLEESGAKLIAIACNTSHYFLKRLQSEITIPIVDLQKEVASYLKCKGAQRVGILATTGTISTNLFQKALHLAGIEACVLPDDLQSQVMEIIYENIKAGYCPAREKFEKLASWFWGQNCEAIILGCTELSTLKDKFLLDDRFVDALEIVAKKIILFFGKELKQKEMTRLD